MSEEKRRERRFAQADEHRELLSLFREQLQVPYVPFPARKIYYKKRQATEEQKESASPKDHEPGSSL